MQINFEEADVMISEAPASEGKRERAPESSERVKSPVRTIIVFVICIFFRVHLNKEWGCTFKGFGCRTH